MGELLAYKAIISAGVGMIVLAWLAKELFKRLDSCTRTTLEITQQYHTSVTANTAQGRAIEKTLDGVLLKLEELQ